MDIAALGATPCDVKFIKDLDFEDYNRLPALRSSVIKEAFRYSDAERQPVLSPLHLKHAYESQDWSDTPSLLFGRALHCLLLEWSEFERRFTYYEGKRDKRHKAYQAFLENHQGMEVLTKEGRFSWDWCLEAAVSVSQHPLVTPFLKDSKRELTALGELEGVPVKVRIDLLSISKSTLLDVKTAASIGPREFYSSFRRYGYDIQLGLYRHVLEQVIEEKWPVVVAAVENTPPFDVAVYEIPEAVLDRGLRLARRVCEAARQGLDSGEWPSFCTEPMALAVPDWDMDLNDAEEQSYVGVDY